MDVRVFALKLLVTWIITFQQISYTISPLL